MTDFTLILATETVTSTDSDVLQTGKLAVETVTSTDSIVRDVSRTLSETATLSDEILRAITRTLVETVTSTDSILRAFSRTLTLETVTLSEVVVFHQASTVKWIKTSASNVVADVEAYLSANVEPGNIISVNTMPISSDNFGVLIVHK